MTAFSEQLKAHTAAAHQHAEDAGFVTELLAGRLDRGQIGALLLQNLIIYRALEEALAANQDPRLQAFADPALARVPALEQDLQVHFGAGWESLPAEANLYVTPGARAYADQLAAMGPTSVAYLLAHHYVRYLGDLSGGQIISTLVQRHYGLGPEGLNFYAFDGVGKLKAYKDAYRQRLDDVELSGSERADVLAHAAAAFETNRQVFVDLMAHRLGSGVPS